MGYEEMKLFKNLKGDTFTVGDTVMHKRFGFGVIVKSIDDTLLHVLFDGETIWRRCWGCDVELVPFQS